MILDENLELADAATLIGSTGSNAIGDSIDVDLEWPGDVGTLYLVVQITTAVDSDADGATISFQLSSDAQDPVADNGSETIHLTSPVFAEADLIAGFTWIVQLPIAGEVWERWVGLNATVAGEAVTAGACNAFLTLDPHRWVSKPDAVN